MKTAIIFDCEFLAIEGSPQRFWCGPFDPDPVVAQIGAVRCDCSADRGIDSGEGSNDVRGVILGSDS